ncbi:MAG: metallophosphoesterase family protein [Bacteroidetes bacterium]|nr:metallophosphoesterase family protein [Bacteroidota bacterium]
MRIALLADIHGNAVALEAVLANIDREGGADEYWILGDVVALGPDPVGVMERLALLPGLRMIRGNTDRYVVFGDRPSPTLDEARQDPKLLPTLVEVAGTFAWTQGMVTAAGLFERLRDLPLELRVTLPDGTRLLGVHASPQRDDGTGVYPGIKDHELEALFDGCDDTLVCMGHTHLPFEHRWKGIHLVNPGAVSLSLTADRDAHYAILEATRDGYTLNPRRVPYDHQLVIDQLIRAGHPGRAFLIKHLSRPEQQKDYP